MIKITPIADFVQDILLRLKDEYTAHIFYRDAANWCNFKGFTKAAKYFENEAKDELKHSRILQDFLNGWGVNFAIPDLITSFTFDSLKSVLEQAYELEAKLYENYNENAIDSMNEDISAFNLFSEMVAIQKNAVAEYLTINDKYSIVEKENSSIFNFENIIFSE